MSKKNKRNHALRSPMDLLDIVKNYRFELTDAAAGLLINRFGDDAQNAMIGLAMAAFEDSNFEVKTATQFKDLVAPSDPEHALVILHERKATRHKVGILEFQVAPIALFDNGCNCEACCAMRGNEVAGVEA